MSRVKHNIDNTFQLIEGLVQFLERNTGLTIDPTVQHYIINPQNVLANNRHFINWTAQEGQPNGDATTEGQSVLITGFAYAYLATGDKKYLESAEKYWQAYIDHFFGGQPIPDPPAKYRPNWIINGKEPRLAHYPLTDDGYPTHGGFKGSMMTWINGRTVIPKGAPHWGEYLDKAWFAFNGNLGWNSVNATVYATNPDGSTNWKEYGDQWDVEWIIDRLGRKVDWDGNILSTGHSFAEYGTVQLKNASVNGDYKFNYATCNPVEHGGYLLKRNEMWHNRPVNVPVELGYQDNASDAETWWCDANYLMYQITGERKYWLCWQSSLLLCQDYSNIDMFDKFFRRSTTAIIPFTDGISYDYSYPSTAIPKYSRDELGYTVIRQDVAAQTTLEQQAVWFRVDQNSKLRIEFQGVDDAGEGVLFRPELELSKTKSETDTVTYRCGLPLGAANMTKMDIPLSSFMRTEPPGGGVYIIAEPRIIVDWGSNTVIQYKYATGIAGTNSDQIVSANMDSDGGFTIGFWLTPTKTANLKSITYRSYADDFNITITDSAGWRWWAMLEKTNSAWVTKALSPADFKLSTWQPNHNDTETKPSSINLTAVDQMNIALDSEPANGLTGAIDFYCVNDIPSLYSSAAGDDYTMYFRVTVSSENPYTAKLGDCTILDYKLDSLNYTPGIIPFSNISDPNTALYDGWRGIPYPGYQYPSLYCFKGRDIDWVRMNNSIDFLYDSQMWFYNKFAPVMPGPMAQAYVWDRWDAHKYGNKNEFTMYHWNDKAWDGYEARAFFCACHTVYELKQRGAEVPEKLLTVCKNWINYLKWFQDNNEGRTPTIFYPNGEVAAPVDDFTSHMSALFMAGCAIMGMAGYDSEIPNIKIVADRCFELIQENYIVLGPNHVMNGCWSAAPRPDSDNGVFFGFHAGELLRGFGLYALYKKLNPQNALPVLDSSNIPALTVLTMANISVDVTE